MIDTHSHIYSVEFDNDRHDVILRAKSVGIEHIILPNVDSKTLPLMLALEAENPNYCHAAIGLHPTSIAENYETELTLVRSELERRNWIAIGEIGIDLYWDKTFLVEQVKAFKTQIEWALEYNLPVIIHVRDSFRETMNALLPYKNLGLKGVFHSFTGNYDEATEILNFGGFLLGINGIVTFKNSGLSETIQQLKLENLIIETDSPYLTPAPYRGKRNESAYVDFVCEKLAAIFAKNKEYVAEITTQNAKRLFSL